MTLDEIKKTKGLENMALVRLGRLSVQPVTAKEYELVQKLAEKRGTGSEPKVKGSSPPDRP